MGGDPAEVRHTHSVVEWEKAGGGLFYDSIGPLTQRLSAFRKKPKIHREDIFAYYTLGVMLTP